MNEQYIERTLSELKSSSITSLIMIILGALCLLASLYYSATRLTPLETEVHELSTKINELELQAKEKQHELNELEQRFETTTKQLSVSLTSLNMLQEGIRYLFNRQYAETINSFSEYLKLNPNSLKH